jgi:hypothetical protein
MLYRMARVCERLVTTPCINLEIINTPKAVAAASESFSKVIL